MHSAGWVDYTGNLSGFIFSSNYTGSWQNSSWQPFGGNLNQANYSSAAPMAAGVYGWQVWANDTFNAFNVTPVQAIAVVANTPPTIVSQTILPAVPTDASSLNCSLVMTDPDVGQALQANFTWWVDGVRNTSFDANNVPCTNATVCASSVSVPPAASAPPQSWKCQATAFDDHGGVNQSNLTVSINYQAIIFPDYGTYIENNTNSSHGSETLLKVGYPSGSSFDNRALLHFSYWFLPPSAVINNATLRAFLETGSSDIASQAIAVLNVTSQWNASATWNASDGADSWPAGGSYNASPADTRLVGYSSSYFSWNATRLAQGWTLANNGLMLAATTAIATKAFGSNSSPDGHAPLMLISFTGSSTPPFYYGAYSNLSTVVAGDPVLQSAGWTVFTGNLSGFIFSSNYTGSWQNSSWQPLTGNINQANYSVSSPLVPGVYGWQIWANGTLGAFNATPVQAIAVVANTPPSILQVATSPQYPVALNQLGCSFTLTDPDLGQKLKANVSWWENGVHNPSYDSFNIACTNATTCVSPVNVSAGFIQPPQTWTCKVAAFDDHGGVNQTGVSTTVNFQTTFYPDADTYIENLSNSSYGSSVLLKVGEPSGSGPPAYENRALLHFNVSSALTGVLVTKAVLGLFLNVGSSDFGSATIADHAMGAAWTENATWNTSDGTTPWDIESSYNSTAEDTQAITVTTSYTNFSATQMAGTWSTGGNNGVIFSENAPIGQLKAFNSRESGTNDSFLWVRYVDFPPSFINATILPSNPIDTENLNCTFWLYDAYRPSVLANVTWWLNGNHVATFDSNAIACTNSTVCYPPVGVNYTNTSANQQWTCQVTAYDSAGAYLIQNASATINSYAQITMPQYPTFADEGDMVLQEASPGLVDSTHPLLQVDSTNPFALQRSTLSFNVPAYVPLNSTINNATLVLMSAGPAASNVSAYAIDETNTPWQSDWLNRTAGLQWQSAGGDYLPAPVDTQNPPSTGPAIFNVTSAAANWTNSSVDWGVLLKFNNESIGQSASFYSGQDPTPSNRPLLLIRFTQVPDAGPQLSNVSVNPSAAYSNSTLWCNFTAESATMPNLVANISWYLNGSWQPSLDAFNVNCANSTACSSPVTLNSTVLARGQSWVCQVTAADRFGMTDQSISSPVTILDSAPSAPAILSPSSGTYDLTVPVSCGGATDIDNDTLNYTVESNYTGSWTVAATGLSDGQAYQWDTQSIPATAGVWLQCRAYDGSAYGGYLQTMGALTISHQWNATAPLQGTANASSPSPVNWTVNVSGTGNVTCNYTSLPADNTGPVSVTNLTSGLTLPSTNSSTAVWWGCDLSYNNYSVTYWTLPPTLQYAWEQDGSQVSNISTQFLAANANLSNPSSQNYAGVYWQVPCPPGFTCSNNAGTQDSLPAGQNFSLAQQVGAIGDAISFSLASVQQNTTYPTTLALQKIFIPISANNTAGVNFSNVSTGALSFLPPAPCWNGPGSAFSQNASLAILNGSNEFDDSIYWVAGCVNGSNAGWQESSANLSEQDLLISDLVTNSGGLNLTVPWLTGLTGTCFTVNATGGTSVLEPGAPQLLVANASGSCLNATAGPYVQDNRSVTSLNGTAYIASELNVTDLAVFNFTGVNTSLSGRPGWNCTWPQVIGVDTGNYSSPYAISCNAPNITTYIRLNRTQDPAYQVTLYSPVYALVPILANNTDLLVNYTNVSWNITPDANWAANTTTGTISLLANGSTFLANLSEQAPASQVFNVTQNLTYSGYNWTMLENATGLDPSTAYYNVSGLYQINYLSVSNITYVAAFNGSSYVNITGPASYTNCTNQTDPAYRRFNVAGANWSGCLGYNATPLQAYSAGFIVPSMGFNSTVMVEALGLDYLPPIVLSASPQVVYNPQVNQTLSVSEPAACRVSNGTDADYSNMSLVFGPPGYSSSPWYYSILPPGNNTFYARCADMAGNTMNASFAYNVTVDSCGDGACQAQFGETCTTCPADCGACPATGGGGGGSGGGGTVSGGGGGGGYSGSAGAAASDNLQVFGLPTQITVPPGTHIQFNGTLQNNILDLLYNAGLTVAGVGSSTVNYTPFGFIGSSSYSPFNLYVQVPNVSGLLNMSTTAFATTRSGGQQVFSPQSTPSST